MRHAFLSFFFADVSRAKSSVSFFFFICTLQPSSPGRKVSLCTRKHHSRGFNCINPNCNKKTSASLLFSNSNSGGIIIDLTVERSLQVSATQARDAWLDYQFQQGANLPGVWILPVRSNNDDDKQRRLVCPVLFEETIESIQTKNNGIEEIIYKVTDFGWLIGSEFLDDSHIATVTFVPANNGCIMTWHVQFQAKNRRGLWQAITRQNIETASNNLVCYTAIPNLYTHRTLLQADNVANAVDQWIEFCWKNGGGLPIPPPIQLPDQKTRMYVPPFLQERVTAINRSSVGEIHYQVVNPSLWTTYPVHSHKGRVRFVPVGDNNQVEMIWCVEVRPNQKCQFYIRTFTSAIISTMACNFQVHLAEPGATVALSPPRGKGSSLAKIPKDTWLGRVLAAHLQDNRPVVEQTLSMLQPWTWGQPLKELKEDEQKWTVEYMPP